MSKSVVIFNEVVCGGGTLCFTLVKKGRENEPGPDSCSRGSYRRGMAGPLHPRPPGPFRSVPVLILRIRNVPAIDATGLHVLEELHLKCCRQKTQLVFSGVTKQPYSVFKQSGSLEEVGPENFCPTIDEALKRADAGVDLMRETDLEEKL